MFRKLLMKKISKNLIKFGTVGTIWTIIPILMAGYLIDLINMAVIIGSVIIASTTFIGKYSSYLAVRFLKQRSFRKYAVVQGSFAAINISSMYFLVEILNLTGVLSATILSISLFFGRFSSFYILKAVR